MVCPYKKKKMESLDIERHRKEGLVKTEAETEAKLPQRKEIRQPGESGRGKEEVFPSVC